MSAWIAANATLLWWTAVFSGVAFVASLVIIPLIVIRIPADYFAATSRRRGAFAAHHPVLRALALVLKNLLGVALVLAGIAMLVLPGQGVLTLLMGLMMIDFPGKFAFERWLVTRRPVLAVITRLRDRAGRAPLEFGSAD